jgi:hypothetical protein
MMKLLAVAVIANQVLTVIFAFVVEQVDPGTPALVTSVFSFLTCGLVSMWLQSDARRAYQLACEKGWVKPVDSANPAVRIAPDCPKRWLVTLHIEMHPAVVGL